MRHTTRSLTRRIAVAGSAAALALGAVACETDDASPDDPVDDEIREDTGDADLEEGEDGIEEGEPEPGVEDDDLLDEDDADG